ncbi:hypothetical protein FORC55_1090 [Vibrio cholerae]|uniref:hypothetical protein n=1 Tax=Vibrio cholerae TaxID=666 RepID=UPI000BB56DDF|nr:hypothetical protein [Vibrio cholerae]ATD27074.1 hypothetical protein FORC55_1090 [Vibrio cholerae]
MSKHKHYDMIVAKAANMDLVKFIKLNNWWTIDSRSSCHFDGAFEYFLCLPRHKEVCLHWLNGGDAELKHASTNGWTSFSRIITWDDGCVFMQADCKFRIKPRKEKRWIGYCTSTNQCTPHPTKTKDLAIDYAAAHYNYADSDWQFIEIEVEVAA